ncbi:MAG: TonB-dependent receptor [Acidobacteria bacterium]|nr:TonB-dependent receptor [Acidobacteriota bacterium]
MRRSGIALPFLLLLCLLCLQICADAQSGYDLSGVVKDTNGAAVEQASISILNARQSVIASTSTDSGGHFILRGIPQGSYELLVRGGRGFAQRSKALIVPSPESSNIEILLGFEALTAEVTVAADVGVVQSVDQASQQVNVIDERKLERRAKAVLAQIAQEEPGLQLQRTSPTIGAIFVRGLTGAKVVTFVDGIRFSTSAARGGINTFFNINDVSNLRAVEVLRGPNSAQFGSDSIGGSVQLITNTPLYTAGKPEVHGRVSTRFNSADLSYGSNSLLTFGNEDLAVLVNFASHRSNTVRSGGGFDSHAAVNRFLGIRSDIFGTRSADTAFTQYGGLMKLNYRLSPTDQLSVYYNRAQIDGGKRFDQTLGGDGNLIADLRNFMLDLFYLRYEKFKAGPFDSFSVSYSYNSQREERVNQGGNGNPLGGITHQYERTMVNGVQLQLTRQLGSHNNLVIGGEFYYDYLRSPAYTFNPSDGSVVISRPRVPDKATYRSGGVYIQDGWTVIPERLRLAGALRYSGASYKSRADNSQIVSGNPLWPDDQLTASSLTPRFGAVFTIARGFNLSAQVSRGFRSPHMTDLGTLGLTGNGFEAPAADLEGKGATIGTTADRNALSTGISVSQLVPETSWSYEGGIHLQLNRINIDVNGFVNDIYDNIVLQSLILPQGATSTRLGDQTITMQLTNGVVFVPASTNPVLIRSNYGDARIHGIEQSLELRVTNNWTVSQNYTWLHAEDRRTGLPPNIEGGTPAPQGSLRLRYDWPRRRFWIEPYLYGARRQDRLSTLDLEDRRTGATRSRTNIRNFFLNGATARGLVVPGTDGRFGTADDILNPTGETLVQVQNRLLGTANSAPLYSSIPGFLILGIRGGFRIGERQNFIIDFENLNDKNYRGISWGMDAPGRGLSFIYNYRF